jgi:hypothetical protein
MKFSRIILFIGLLVFANNIAFAQYDDDDDSQSRKASSKKEHVKTPKGLKSNATQSKTREDLFRSSVNKTTYLSKKEQSKLISKKQRNKEHRYDKTRGELNNKSTVKRMKKSEKHSYQINNGQNAPFFKRVTRRLNPKNGQSQRRSSRKSSKLQKQQDDARSKYESKEYGKNGTRDKKKKKKLRTFYNPLSGMFKK